MSDKKTYDSSVKELDDNIRVYAEQKKELRKEYLDNKWLTKDDIKYIMKAYRLAKDQTDMVELDKVYSELLPLVEDEDGADQ
jgi:5-bromo-4-chloroindolyl phosphate hydrolysis protein